MSGNMNVNMHTYIKRNIYLSLKKALSSSRLLLTVRILLPQNTVFAHPMSLVVLS